MSLMAQTDFYAEVNRYRAQHLRRPLVVDTVLAKSARAWIVKTRGILAHDHNGNFGEVLARCENPLRCWIESPHHRKIILGRYKRIGYAEVNGVACARLK